MKYILANDPSMTAWGWVLFDATGKIEMTGAIKTSPADKKLRIRKGDDRIRRVSELVQQLNQILLDYHVRLLLSEQPHGSQSASAAIMIGMTAGIMQTLADVHEIPIEWYSEGEAKKSISGKRSVAKDDMVALVDELYDVPWGKHKWQNQAIADAIAVYHVAKQNSEMMKMLTQ